MSDLASMHRELFWLMCDERIGYGVSRVVHSSKVLRDHVIKVEENGGRFQNVIEWETWQRVKETDLAQWFAPCEWISANGSVLVMAKTTPAVAYPEKMPAFLGDFKRANYGMRKGRLVCHDYGTNLLMENGMTKRMRKVEWGDL